MCPLPEDSSCHLTHPATPDEFSPQERKLLLHDSDPELCWEWLFPHSYCSIVDLEYQDGLCRVPFFWVLDVVLL